MPRPGAAFDQWPVAPSAIYCLFLTHAHIENAGGVPFIVDAAFRSEILCTYGNRALLVHMFLVGISFSDRTDRRTRPMKEKNASWFFSLFSRTAKPQKIRRKSILQNYQTTQFRKPE